ncbi:hypothetical protein CTE05_29340 [Cellulomonas terrae]|uniref:Transcription factor zinc-finger domain-containing protein n=1 Tax=Cellulomonas terrae TaxID=311234 RepID=A0A511JMY7_9CELL|nr:hypothetical protein CTE05_29340 [Cellulomonas terrae]
MSSPCPRCHQGSVDRYLLVATSEQLFVCDECEAAWPDDRIDLIAFSQLTDVTEDRGLTPLWTELRKLGDDHDSSDPCS